MKKVMVFGGTGWLGHLIVIDLQNHGYDVTLGTRGTSNKVYEKNVENARVVVIDKEDEQAMKELLAERFDIIIDSVPTMKSIELVYKYAAGLRHYLHCSSTGGYTPLPFVPCNETAPYHGAAGDGWNKKAIVDAEIMRLFNVEGFPGTVIRPCYITGGGDRLPLDNLGGRRETFIPDILAGKVLEVPDNGLALLQPIHVEDLARSFRLAIENRRSIGERYNICLDHALTLNDYLELNAFAVGKKAVLEHVPLAELLVRHPEDPVGLKFVAQHMCFSIEKAKSEIGYVPEHTVEETIMETARAIAAKL